MPRNRMAPSLQSMCYPPIVEMLWDWWLNSREEQLGQVDQVMEYLRLPSRFTCPLLEMLDDKHTVFTGHLLLFLKCGIDAITLTRMYFVQFDRLLQLADAAALQKLLFLDISRSRVSHETIAITPKAIPCIRVLKLQFTACTDDVIASIADHCSELEDLDISYCPVTDTAIQHLVSKQSKCRDQIKSINIVDTKISIDGAVNALDGLSNLQELECHDIMDILARSFEKNRTRVYKLRFFRFGSDHHSYRKYLSNQELVSRCYYIAPAKLPFLSHIVIKDWNPQTPEGLQPFCQCDHLIEIEFDVQFCPFLTMADISHLLDIRGHQLLHINLKQVQNVDVLRLVDTCPHLKTLQLQSNTYAEVDGEPLGNLSDLTDLTVIGSASDSALVTVIASCPSLECLNIHHSYNFTPDVLQNILNVNALPALQEVWFLECDRLTVDGLHMLIDFPNKLREMRVEYCRVSLKEHNGLMNWIKRNHPTVGLDLQVQSRIW